MEQQNNMPLNGSFFGYPQFNPFFSNYSSIPSFNWQNTPGYATSFLNKLGDDLSSLGQLIDSNSKSLVEVMKRCQKLDDYVEKLNVDINDNNQESKKENKEIQKSISFRQPNQIPFFTHQPLVKKIFHKEKFKYKLKLSHRIPKIIYKDRKLTFKVKIINPDGSPICNVNLIHLCLGACHQNGEWILNQDGQLFMRGKIEVDLYHGEAQFKRIYPSDISRRYTCQPIKIVIYPKGSILKFTNPGQKHEKQINPDEIEPYIVSDITVKAKRKF